MLQQRKRLNTDGRNKTKQKRVKNGKTDPNLR